MQKIARKSKGFTIIEVLIVLAIAGLIMVVVFLAVPALQRSGRNNSANTNANNVLTGVGTYSSNNGGTVPDKAVLSAPGVVTISKIAGSDNPEDVKVDASVTAASASSTIPAVPPKPGELVVVFKATCNTTGTGAIAATNGRAYVVLYGAESGSGGNKNIVKCIGS